VKPPTLTPTLALAGLTPASMGGIAELPQRRGTCFSSIRQRKPDRCLVVAASVGILVVGAAWLALRRRGAG